MTDRSGAPPRVPRGGPVHEGPGPRRVALALAALAARAALLLVARVRIRDLAVPPARGQGTILAFNHRSMLDIVVCVIAAQRWGAYPRTFARADFFTRLGIGWLLRRLGAIPAGGRVGTAATLVVGCDILRRGGAIAIAPEGRIVPAAQRTAGLGRLMGGIGVMSSRLGAPILLSAITGADQAWPIGSRTPVLHLPWHRPEITVSAEWLEVPAGTPPADVTAGVARGLRELLDTAEHAHVGS